MILKITFLGEIVTKTMLIVISKYKIYMLGGVRIKSTLVSDILKCFFWNHIENFVV